MCRCMELFFPWCRTWHFPLLKLMRFLLACFSLLLVLLGLVIQPSGVSACPSSSVPEMALLIVVLSVPIAQV